jgi:hypothetical protein
MARKHKPTIAEAKRLHAKLTRPKARTGKRNLKADASGYEARMGPAGQRYQALTADREPYLIRARRQAGLTIPYLFREQGANQTTDEPNTWQSFGGYAVNNLASKIVLALFPAGRPNFRLTPSRSVLKSLQQFDPDTRGAVKAEIGKGLSMVEQEVSQATEEDGDRSVQFDAARHMITGGNHGFQFYPDGSLRGISLERFVIVRDPAGNLLEFVLCDCMAYETLPPDIQEEVKRLGFPYDDKQPVQPRVDVYTHGSLQADKTWKVYQEVFGMTVEGSEANYATDFLPFQFPPMILLHGENYGRSYCEDYEGDLQTLDGLTETVTTGSAAAALLIRLVKPGAAIQKKQLAEANNGDVLTGQEGDVTTLVTNKTADFQQASALLQQIVDRLTRAFLLNSAVQRGGERVTAEEIRYVAQELEDALGGVYSNQVVTWQTPYAKLKLHYGQKSGRVTKLPPGMAKVTVIAGMAALGRNADLEALDTFIQGGAQTIGAQGMVAAINPRIYMARRAAALGIDADGLIFTDQEASAMAQSEQQKALIGMFGPEIVKQLGQYMTATSKQSIANQGQQQPPAEAGQTPQGQAALAGLQPQPVAALAQGSPAPAPVEPGTTLGPPISQGTGTVQ